MPLLALADPSFLPIINATAGYAYQDRRPVPFAVFDEENNNQRLDVGFLENNAVGGKEDGKYDPPSTNSGIDNCTVTREYAFIFATNYKLQLIIRLFRQIFLITIRP